MFGDGQPVWRGEVFPGQNLTLAAHVPTKSEFYIWVQKPQQNDNDATNIIFSIFEKIRQKAGAVKTESHWEEIAQHFDNGKKGTELKTINYFRFEFIGTRFGTDYYLKTDQVSTVGYIACLTPEKPASKSWYSVAVTTIPVTVSEDEKDYLLKVLDDFLREGIAYSF
jgi:hypothetical protein